MQDRIDLRTDQAAGFVSASASILATAGVGVVNVLMTLVAIRLIDRRGRRGLLLWGLAGMAASLVGLAAGFAFGAASGALGMLTTVALTAYVGFFAIGLGPVFWLLISEIFPLHIRGRAMGVESSLDGVLDLVDRLLDQGKAVSLRGYREARVVDE